MISLLIKSCFISFMFYVLCFVLCFVLFFLSRLAKIYVLWLTQQATIASYSKGEINHGCFLHANSTAGSAVSRAARVLLEF